MDVKFYKSVHNIAQLPKDKKPEIVLMGRSNVGKSSFINSFFNRRKLAQISSTPGKTRSINFYEVDSKLYFVDLPGFGYAKVGADESKRWKKLIEDYLFSERNFLTAVHFIDARIGITELDFMLNYFLNENAIPFIVVLNKIDKLNNNEKKKAIDKVISDLGGAIERERIFIYSSTKNIGKKELKTYFNTITGKKIF